MPDSNGNPKLPGSAPARDHVHNLLDEARAAAEEVLQEELARNPNASIEELNAALQQRAFAINHRPQKEMGNLSPDQVRRLLADDWTGPGGVLRLNSTLTLADLEGSQMLHNARVFLAYLHEQGALRATATGNLPRAAVKTFIDSMRWRATYIEELLRYSKVINERDAYPLHVLRVVLDLAGLIKKQKGRFSLTRQGAAMMAEERAGALFVLLFRTHFRTLNLGYLDRLPALPDFQQTIAYPLFRLGIEAETWKLPEELADRVVLPFLRAQLPEDDYGDRLAHIVETRVLSPLEGFGLIESREHPKKGRIYPDQAYRKTRLYDRFLRFNLPPILPRGRGPTEIS
jgi:hypothetical protein